MNATSSRSHTIVELKFKQLFKNKAGSLMQRSSTINLVDLAGRLVIYYMFILKIRLVAHNSPV